MYIVNGWSKTSEQDDFQKGFIGRTTLFNGDDVFQDKNLNQLIDKLKRFAGHDAVILDSCNEIGRLDIQGMETTQGNPANEFEIEQWKRGTRVLFGVIYTFYVYKCEPVSLLGE